MNRYNLQSIKQIIENKNLNLREVLNLLNTTKNQGEEENISEILEELGYENRVCSVCKKIILQGYCIEGGYLYACSDSCVKEFKKIEEFKYLYKNGEINMYFTDFNEIDRTGIPIKK